MTEKQYADSIVRVIKIYTFLKNSIDSLFETEKLLKQSPRGSVHLIRHKASGKKFVFRQYSGSCEVYKKLLTVQCPYLPQIAEAAEENGQSAVLEEYIIGDELSFLIEGVRLTDNETRLIVSHLCKALWVLHSMGVVHRDVKPENVIIRGSDAVLIDFDASRTYKPEMDTDTQVMGTTGYAAPEQFGLNQTDARADIYSLGVLMNIMLTGMHPTKKLASGKMGRIIQKCTMTSPDKRYQSVLQLMDAL